MKKLVFMVAFIVTLLSISESRVNGASIKGGAYLYEEISIAVQGNVYAGTSTLSTDGTFDNYAYFKADYFWSGTGTVGFKITPTPGTPTAWSPQAANQEMFSTNLLSDAKNIRFRTTDGGIGTISAHYSLANKEIK